MIKPARTLKRLARPAIALALVAIALYGGALWGVLPTRSGVSWEGHLAGFGAGAVAAGAGTSRRRPSLPPA